jgi:hypothetical protein
VRWVNATANTSRANGEPNDAVASVQWYENLQRARLRNALICPDSGF